MNNRSLSVSLVSVSLLSTILVASIAPSFSQSAAADRVTFFCKEVYDRASGNKIPATLAWVPGRGGNVRVVGWKSEYFSKKGWDAQKRCAEVTSKFQKAYDEERLNFMTTGRANGYPIICAVVGKEDSCDSGVQLFTIKPHDNPDLVLQQLIDILEGTTSDMLLQSSGNQIYVSMSELFNKAPITDRDAPPRTKPAGPQQAENPILP